MTILPVAVISLLLAASAVAQPSDCLPLTPAGTQGGALLPGGMMNVRFGGTSTSPLAIDVYPHADASPRPLAVVLRGGKGTVGQRSSYVGQFVETFGDFPCPTFGKRPQGSQLLEIHVAEFEKFQPPPALLVVQLQYLHVIRLDSELHCSCHLST